MSDIYLLYMWTIMTTKNARPGEFEEAMPYTTVRIHVGNPNSLL